MGVCPASMGSVEPSKSKQARAHIAFRIPWELNPDHFRTTISSAILLHKVAVLGEETSRWAKARRRLAKSWALKSFRLLLQATSSTTREQSLASFHPNVANAQIKLTRA